LIWLKRWQKPVCRGLALVRHVDLRDTLLLAVLEHEQDVAIPDEVLNRHLVLSGQGPTQLLLPFLDRQRFTPLVSQRLLPTIMVGDTILSAILTPKMLPPK